jgi:glutamate dehydrogenase (NAD(P)+)
MVNYDSYGPEKILYVYNPKVGMRGFVVIDSTALGPAKGGIRMTPSVSVEEVSRLARAMTWKCALANIPFGGGKSGIVADDKNMTPQKKKQIIQAFAVALRQVCPSIYVAAPDMNTAEKEMETFSKANGSRKSCTGKPKKLGGLPHELGSTGFGVFHATDVACKHKKIKLKGATVAIEGFGNVGWFAAKFLSEAGAKLVAVSDSRGVAHDEKGLDFKELARVKKETGTVVNYLGCKKKHCSHITEVKADILVTAAVPDLIKVHDVDKLKFKIIVEGSNIPMTAEVEDLVHKKGILVVPDFVANAGGVISSYVEFIGGNEKKMFSMVKKKLRENTDLVLKQAKNKKCSPRKVALQIAQKRVSKKCKVCSVHGR